MKLLRAGGGYLKSETDRHGSKRLWILCLGVCAAIVVGLAWHPVLALVPLFIAASQARPIHRKVRRVQRGLEGEESITALLQHLPDDYLLVNDVVLPRGRGNVDHVLLGPCGIVVIETKNYSELLGVILAKAKQNRLQPTMAETLAYSLRRQGRVHDIPV